MGRPDYTERFEELYRKKGDEEYGNAALLRDMYKKHFKGQGGVKDQQEWIDSKLPDLRKMIKGDRPFPEQFIVAIEKALDMKFVDILDPPKQVPEEKEEFKPRGIRYAASRDQEEDYDALYDKKDCDGDRVILNYDEYTKTIIDYIIEYKARNGLKFLVDKGLLSVDNFFNFSSRIYRVNEHRDDLWDFIIELDDPEMFIQLFPKKYLLFLSYRNRDEAPLEKIMQTENIFKALCSEQEADDDVFYMPTLLCDALRIAQEQKNDKKVRQIVEAYTNFVQAQESNLSEDAGSENGELRCESMNDFAGIDKVAYNGKVKFYVWDISVWHSCGFEINDPELRERMEYCTGSSLENRHREKKLREMKEGDSFVKNNKLYIKKPSDDVSTAALRYLSLEKECPYLPTYYDCEAGVSAISICRGTAKPSSKELGAIASKIHALSQQKLGSDRVYSYAVGLNFGWAREPWKNNVVIEKWDSCVIRSAFEDIINIIMNSLSSDPYNYYLRFVVEAGKTFEQIKEFLNSYENKETIELFGDKLNEQIDDWFDNGQSNIPRNCLGIVKGFAKEYQEKFNDITRYEAIQCKAGADDVLGEEN